MRQKQLPARRADAKHVYVALRAAPTSATSFIAQGAPLRQPIPHGPSLMHKGILPRTQKNWASSCLLWGTYDAIGATFVELTATH